MTTADLLLLVPIYPKCLIFAWSQQSHGLVGPTVVHIAWRSLGLFAFPAITVVLFTRASSLAIFSLCSNFHIAALLPQDWRIPQTACRLRLGTGGICLANLFLVTLVVDAVPSPKPPACTCFDRGEAFPHLRIHRSFFSEPRLASDRSPPQIF